MFNKYLLVAMLFIVIFTTGYFGQKLGYNVHGVPHGAAVLSSNTEDWQNADYGLDVVFAFWHKYSPKILQAPVSAIEYLTYFAAFQIDNVPDWMVGISDLFVLLVVVLIFNAIRGNN